jgi:hypothetical protein
MKRGRVHVTYYLAMGVARIMLLTLADPSLPPLHVGLQYPTTRKLQNHDSLEENKQNE